MEHEIKYYLRQTKAMMQPYTNEELKAIEHNNNCVEDMPVMDVRKIFTPQYFITAVKLPTGAIEIAVNTQNISEKIDYILEAYDDNMFLKTNTEIRMQNIMIV